MSNFAIEKMLWQAFQNPADAGAYRADADAFLVGFRMDEDEKALIKAWDVAALADRGVNPMLILMAYNACQPGANMMDYIGKINAPR